MKHLSDSNFVAFENCIRSWLNVVFRSYHQPTDKHNSWIQIDCVFDLDYPETTTAWKCTRIKLNYLLRISSISHQHSHCLLAFLLRVYRIIPMSQTHACSVLTSCPQLCECEQKTNLRAESDFLRPIDPDALLTMLLLWPNATQNRCCCFFLLSQLYVSRVVAWPADDMQP